MNTGIPYGWWITGVVLIAFCLWLAFRYMEHEHERNCERVADESPMLVGAELDATVPPCGCVACQADDLVEEIQQWLRARDRYETGLS